MGNTNSASYEVPTIDLSQYTINGEDSPFYYPYHTTFFCPIFGLPEHIQSFIQCSSIQNSNRPIFSSCIITPTQQPISKGFTINELVTNHNREFYNIEMEQPKRLYDVIHTDKDNIVRVLQYDIDTIEFPELIKSTTDDNNNNTKQQQQQQQEEDISKISFTTIHFGLEPSIESPITDFYEFINHSYIETQNQLPSTFLFLPQYLRKLLPLHGLKSKFKPLPLLSSSGQSLSQQQIDKLPFNLPPPRFIQTIPIIGYDFERLVHFAHTTKAPAHQLATFILLDLTDIRSRGIIFDFVTKTQQLLLKGCILPLNKVYVHIIAFNADKIDQLVINEEEVDALCAQIGFDSDMVTFYSFNMETTYKPKETSIFVPDEYKSLQKMVWDQIWAKYMYLFHENYLHTTPIQPNQIHQLCPSHEWPIDYFAASLQYGAHKFRQLAISTLTKPLQEICKIKLINGNENDNETIIARAVLYQYIQYINNYKGYDTTKINNSCISQLDIKSEPYIQNYINQPIYHLNESFPTPFPLDKLQFDPKTHNENIPFPTQYIQKSFNDITKPIIYQSHNGSIPYEHHFDVFFTIDTWPCISDQIDTFHLPKINPPHHNKPNIIQGLISKDKNIQHNNFDIIHQIHGIISQWEKDEVYMRSEWKGSVEWEDRRQARYAIKARYAMESLELNIFSTLENPRGLDVKKAYGPVLPHFLQRLYPKTALALSRCHSTVQFIHKYQGGVKNIIIQSITNDKQDEKDGNIDTTNGDNVDNVDNDKEQGGIVDNDNQPISNETDNVAIPTQNDDNNITTTNNADKIVINTNTTEPIKQQITSTITPPSTQDEYKINITYQIRQGSRTFSQFHGGADWKAILHDTATYPSGQYGRILPFLPLAYLYGVRVIPFVYAHHHLRSLITQNQADRENKRVEYQSALDISPPITPPGYPKGFIPPPLPNLHYKFPYNYTNYDDATIMVKEYNQPTLLESLFPTLYRQHKSTPIIGLNDIITYTSLQMNCPMHIIIICCNPIADDNNEELIRLNKQPYEPVRPGSYSWGDARSLDHYKPEPITQSQYRYFNENIPQLYMNELTHILYPFATPNISMEKIEKLWRIHFITMNEFDIKIQEIQSNAIDIRLNMYKDVAMKSPTTNQ